MSDAGYSIPAARHRVEDVIERSRFITTVAPAVDPAAARAFIDEIRGEFPDATHNCWAYACGAPGSTAVIGMSDAGEPHGTAGRPMLDVLLHSGIGEVAAVVTRYYGGVKLGKGGLVRAYGGCVQHALTTLPLTERVSRDVVDIIIGYGDIDLVRRTIDMVGGELLAQDYAEEVRYTCAVPSARRAEFERALGDATGGGAVVTEV